MSETSELPELGQACETCQTFVGGRNLVTPHAPDAYPGILVVRPGPDWSVAIIVLGVGQSFTARGGETAYGYDTVDGGTAEGFELKAGDRATLVRSGLPFAFVEWRIERACS